MRRDVGVKGQTRAARDGMILVNVLFIVALAAIVVTLMVSSQDVSLDRSLRLRESSQAGAYARAGELSAVAALRRDAVAAPESDNFSEPWAQVEDADVVIAGGRFSLAVIDDQARFNLNSLTTGGLVAEDRLARILAALGIRSTLREPIIAYVRLTGGLSNLENLSGLGMTPGEINTLGELATTLPKPTSINLNTADERMLAVLFDSPVTGRLLASTRKARGGVLTAQDLMALNAFAPAGVGFQSDFYKVVTRVTTGETQQTLVSSLMRIKAATGANVVVYARRRTAAEPVLAPPRS